MVVEPYWINTQLAIVPRPRGGDWLDDEMRALRHAGIDVLVSMIEPYEARELGLEREEASATQAGLQFVSFPIQDRCTPSDLDKFNRFLAGLEQSEAQGKRIGVHCRGCIGRASVVAASLLIRAGIPAETAWTQVERARGCPVPDTLEQLEWVAQYIRPLP
jgi:protein-tyrosine phosphatase